MPESSSMTILASSVSRQSLFAENRSSQTTTSSTAYNKVDGHGAEYNNCMRCRCRQRKEKKGKGQTYTSYILHIQSDMVVSQCWLRLCCVIFSPRQGFRPVKLRLCKVKGRIPHLIPIHSNLEAPRIGILLTQT